MLVLFVFVCFSRLKGGVGGGYLGLLSRRGKRGNGILASLDPLNDWEVDVVGSFLVWLHEKRVCGYVEDMVLWTEK